MVGGQVDVQEHRRAVAFARDHAGGIVEIEAVGLEHTAADIPAVDEILHARTLVERAGTEEATEYRIDRKRAVAATAECMRQAARHPAAGNPRHEELEAAE